MGSAAKATGPSRAALASVVDLSSSLEDATTTRLWGLLLSLKWGLLISLLLLTLKLWEVAAGAR